MKVLLFGASGNIGSAIARELVVRGHDVTAATRTGRPVDGLDITVRRADATQPDEVRDAAAGQDAIVSAVGPRHGADDDAKILVGAARAITEGARRAGVQRIIAVGGRRQS